MCCGTYSTTTPLLLNIYIQIHSGIARLYPPCIHRLLVHIYMVLHMYNLYHLCTDIYFFLRTCTHPPCRYTYYLLNTYN
ncbi:hypothetical protein AX774_g6878, partial [Zancudomyces culisetae]